MKTIPEEEKKDIVFKAPYEMYGPQGCEKCNNKGFKGRVPIFEVLKMTRELTDVIQTTITDAVIIKEANRQGMTTLRQDGVLKALRGVLYLPDVIKETSS